MNPNPTEDLLAALAVNHWRLDCRHETGHYRVMYYCVECGLWRCVEESGAYHPGPHEAIKAAINSSHSPQA